MGWPRIERWPKTACADTANTRAANTRAGNMTQDLSTGNNYNFDQENRITGAAGYTYTCDADGNRVEKSNGTTGTLYWYMTPGIVAESDLAGNLQSDMSSSIVNESRAGTFLQAISRITSLTISR